MCYQIFGEFSSVALRPNCGLYYKIITIVTLTIVSDATIWSITYDRN